MTLFGLVPALHATRPIRSGILEGVGNGRRAQWQPVVSVKRWW